MISGFIVVNDNFMRVYKKVEITYVCVAEYFIPEIGFCQQIVLSPQQDILIYYQTSNSSIRYIKHFSEEIEKSIGSTNKNIRQLKISGSIEFNKSSNLAVFTSRENNTFAIAENSNLNLYSMATFDNYIKYSVESISEPSYSTSINPLISNTNNNRLKRKNTMGSLSEPIVTPEPILAVALHPHL